MPAAASLLLLVGCGNAGGYDAHLNDLPRTGAATCLTRDEIGAAPTLVVADVDGDGAPDNVQYLAGSGDCARVLFARADAKRRGVKVTGDAPVESRDADAVAIPGRKGALVLLVQLHPRGGFQARLFGYAHGSLEELTVHGEPVFPFVATDVLSHPIAARCVEGGFEVTEGRAHEPIGVVPAWDVFRTTYRVDGNTVTKGATTEVADNVLEKDFRATYAELVRGALFENCRVGQH